METCPHCDQLHITAAGTPSCQAHRNRTQRTQPCLANRVAGLTVCINHGGKLVTRQAKAAQWREEEHTRSILQRLGQPTPIDHPIYELLDLAAEMKAGIEVWREKVAELDAISYLDRQEVDRPRAVIELYERAIDRFSKHLIEMAKLDLQTRALRLKKEAATEVVAAVVRALEKVGLGEHAPEVRQALGAELAKLQETKAQVQAPVLMKVRPEEPIRELAE